MNGTIFVYLNYYLHRLSDKKSFYSPFFNCIKFTKLFSYLPPCDNECATSNRKWLTFLHVFCEILQQDELPYILKKHQCLGMLLLRALTSLEFGYERFPFISWKWAMWVKIPSSQKRQVVFPNTYYSDFTASFEFLFSIPLELIPEHLFFSPLHTWIPVFVIVN